MKTSLALALLLFYLLFKWVIHFKFHFWKRCIHLIIQSVDRYEWEATDSLTLLKFTLCFISYPLFIVFIEGTFTKDVAIARSECEVCSRWSMVSRYEFAPINYNYNPQELCARCKYRVQVPATDGDENFLRVYKPQ